MEIKVNLGNFKIEGAKQEVYQKMTKGLDEAARDLRDVSRPTTPMKTGKLRANIEVSRTPKGSKVIWKQKYAEYQERGFTTGPVRKYTTPGTGKEFVQRAITVIKNKVIQYFRI